MGKRIKKLTRKEKRDKASLMSKTPSKYATTTKTGKTYKPNPPCHSGQNLVFTTDTGVAVYGGGRNRSGGWDRMSFVPDLAMGPSETLVYAIKPKDNTEVPEGWACEQFVGTAESPPPIIALDFPDFGTPKVGVEFWYALAQDVIDKGIMSISTQCAGGHGRTGVQLCILYDLLNTHAAGKPYKDAGELVLLIRDLHCSHAVETKEQQQYIADVCDIPLGEVQIEDRWSGYTNHNYGGGGLGKAIPTTVSIANPMWDDEESGYRFINASEVCGHCDMISFFADTESYCEVCLEPYMMDEGITVTEKKDELTCPCCGELDSLTADGDGCVSCNWDRPPENGETQLCYSCGVTHPLHHFSMYDKENCMQCLAVTIRIKHDRNGVECILCKDVKDNEYIYDFSKQDNGFVCRKCY